MSNRLRRTRESVSNRALEAMMGSVAGLAVGAEVDDYIPIPEWITVIGSMAIGALAGWEIPERIRERRRPKTEFIRNTTVGS